MNDDVKKMLVLWTIVFIILIYVYAATQYFSRIPDEREIRQAVKDSIDVDLVKPNVPDRSNADTLMDMLAYYDVRDDEGMLHKPGSWKPSPNGIYVVGQHYYLTGIVSRVESDVFTLDTPDNFRFMITVERSGSFSPIVGANLDLVARVIGTTEVGGTNMMQWIALGVSDLSNKKFYNTER